MKMKKVLVAMVLSFVMIISMGCNQNIVAEDEAHLPPTMPNLTSTTTSITVSKVNGHEYKLNDGTWQSGNVFESLTANTEYTIHVRVAKSKGKLASSSVSATIKTKKESTTINIQDSNYNAATAITQDNDWAFSTPSGYVFDATNEWLTMRKGNRFGGNTKQTMKNGDIDLKLKLDVAGEYVYIGFAANEEYINKVIYEGANQYVVVFKNTGTVQLQKYTSGAEELLKEYKFDKYMSNQIFDFSIKTIQTNSSIAIEVYFDSVKGIDYVDSTNPYLDGGYVNYGTDGSQMAIGTPTSGTYTEPEAAAIEYIEITDVAKATGTVDMMSSYKTSGLDGFNSDWRGRTGIYNPIATAQGIKLETSVNPEEAGYKELQALYKKAIFDTAEHELDFRIESIGSWMMIYVKVIAKTNNVSAWGNKLTREYAQSYTILISNSKQMRLIKWFEMGEETLLNEQLSDTALDLSNASKLNNIKIKTEKITKAQVDGLQFTININGSEYTATDFTNPYFNAGYFGLQGFEGSKIEIVNAKSTVIA